MCKRGEDMQILEIMDVENQRFLFLFQSSCSAVRNQFISTPEVFFHSRVVRVLPVLSPRSRFWALRKCERKNSNKSNNDWSSTLALQYMSIPITFPQAIGG